MNITQTFNHEIIARLNKHVHDLHVKLYPQYFKEYKFETMKNFFQSIMNNNHFVFLLLEDDNESIGYAWIEMKDYLENPFRNPYKSIYVHHISIIDTKRKKGYGTILMDRVYDIAKENEIELIELDYWSENTMAKDFYEKHGFSKYREFVYKRQV